VTKPAPQPSPTQRSAAPVVRQADPGSSRNDIAAATATIRPAFLPVGTNETVPVRVGKYDTPYVVRYRPLGSRYDLSEPTEVMDALWSTPNRDPQTYLSLVSPEARAKVEAVDRESGGQVLNASQLDAPFPTPDVLQTVFSHWIELTREGKVYRILVGKQIIRGEEHTGLTMTLVKDGELWLQSFDLDNSALLFAAGRTPYDRLPDAR
jgi:hypothetical protein